MTIRRRAIPLCENTKRRLSSAATRAALAALAIVAIGACASATEGPWQKSDQSEARLISATTGVGGRAKLALGIELQLREGWKTYWRSPGDAGLPPSVDWAGSENLRSASFAYPAPHRFEALGLQTVGYSERVIFPVDAELKEPGKPLLGKAELNILVCEKLCIPQVFKLEIAVAAGPATPSEHAQDINRFQSAVPRDGRAAGFTLQSASAIQKGNGVQALQVVVASRDGFEQPDIFSELKSGLSLARPDVALSADRATATFTLLLSRPLPPGGTLVGQSALFTVIDGARSAELQGEIIRGAGDAMSGGGGLAKLAGIIGIALLGGLVLNFMPCVLPILSIKVVSFAKETGKTARQIRSGMTATAAGVVASMLLIAGALIALKSAGIAVGWGIQFQQPLFVASMALILTLFACNFWDLFEVSLPGTVSNFVARSGGEGESAWSNFLIGAFATLLATPCSAPFVGTAVGFALGQGPIEIVSVFAALGVGLASPYLAVAAVPAIARFIPRPGYWMVVLRRVMGLGLALSAAWLITVLAGQVGAQQAWLITLSLLAVALCLALAKIAPRLRIPMVAAAICLAAATLASTAFVGRLAGGDEAGGDRIAWEPLRPDRIKSLVAQGKTVFVDVTADWCLTCKANKRLVLEQSPLVDRLANETVAMRGDWTSPDPKITQFLASFGKYGVPFNVVFGPGEPAGISLPELLTQQAVSAAIDKAAGASVGQQSTNRG